MDFLSFFKQIFSFFSGIHSDPTYGGSVTAEGVDVGKMNGGFLNTVISKLMGKGMADEYTNEKSAIAMEAARQMGYDNGIIPEKELDRFEAVEDKIDSRMHKLKCDLRERHVEVIKANENDPNRDVYNFDVFDYKNTLSNDEKTLEILAKARTEGGLPPQLVESAKQTLVSENQSLNAGLNDTLKNMSLESFSR